MSPRNARSDAPVRADDAFGVLYAAIAVLAGIAYPIVVREVLGVVGSGASVAAALLKLAPIVIDIALARAFLSTLAPGREPAISRFARLERGALEPDLAAYTRRLTAVWGSLFIVMGMIAAALSMPSTMLAWQWWAGPGTWLTVVALFAGERWYRKRRYAHYTHASLARQVGIVARHWISR